MKIGILISIVIWTLTAAYLTGCSGVEIGLKTGIYRVDEHQDSELSSTSAKNNLPLKCYFVNCGGAENGTAK